VRDEHPHLFATVAVDVLDRSTNSEFHRILKRVLRPCVPTSPRRVDRVHLLITKLGLETLRRLSAKVFKQADGKKLTYHRSVNAGAVTVLGLRAPKTGTCPPGGKNFCATIRKNGKS